MSAKEAPGVKTINVVADRGYHNYSDIKKCTDADTVPFVPAPRSETGRRNRVPAEGFYPEDFRYCAAKNIHICPAGNTLEYRYTVNRSNGISFMAYGTDACASCPLKQKCTASPEGRMIRRRVEQDAVDETMARMAANPWNHEEEERPVRASIRYNQEGIQSIIPAPQGFQEGEGRDWTHNACLQS